MARLRVVLLIPTLDQSGAEKQFTLLATGLPAAEFDVHVVALTRGGPYEVDLIAAGIPYTILHKRWKADMACWWRLRKLLAKLKPDILHTWLFAGNAYGRLAVKRQNRPKVIVSERCVDSWKAGWQLRLDRCLVDRTDRLVGNSASVCNFYRTLGVPQEKLTAIPNGLTVPLPSQSPSISAARADLLHEFGLPPSARVVAFVGRLAAQKRVQDLIFAIETLRHIRPDVRLLLVGDGSEQQRLKRFAQAVHADEHVIFAGHRADLHRLWPMCDVFCLPSDFEGQSNSLMEAMAAGLPCVVSDIPANRELITQGETGFLVKPRDSVGYMQFLRLILDDASLARRLGQAAHLRTRRHFTVERMVQRYADLYREVCGQLPALFESQELQNALSENR